MHKIIHRVGHNPYQIAPTFADTYKTENYIQQIATTSNSGPRISTCIGCCCGIFLRYSSAFHFIVCVCVLHLDVLFRFMAYLYGCDVPFFAILFQIDTFTLKAYAWADLSVCLWVNVNSFSNDSIHSMRTLKFSHFGIAGSTLFRCVAHTYSLFGFRAKRRACVSLHRAPFNTLTFVQFLV